jgi:phosphoglycolate phosphatase
MKCNICGSTTFANVKNRVNARCTGCDSFERHRVCYEVYKREGLFDSSRAYPLRILHFAPEKILHDSFANVGLNHYITSDISPHIYKHAQPLKIRLPDDLDIFPDNYFDYLIHNHVWEHIPGNWRDCIHPFMRIVKPSGKMIFTVPFGIHSPKLTIEGGEHLKSDKERMKLFHQSDHLKLFGFDMFEYLDQLDGFRFETDNIETSTKRNFNSPHSRVFLLTKLQQ